MGYSNYIKAFEVNKQGLLKIVSISTSRHLFLLIFFEIFFSCNKISEEEDIHRYNWEFFVEIRLDYVKEWKKLYEWKK